MAKENVTATAPSFADLEAAAGRIREHVHRTPVMTCAALDAAAGGARLFFKCENLQKVGAFKSRGACNAVFSLPDEAVAKGVVAHSSGNHAAALARAAGRRGVPAHIVMPEGSAAVKVEAVRGYGGRVTFCPPTQAGRESAAEAIRRETGATLVHPYDDPRIIAGQGTAALEFLSQVPDLDVLLVPVGGGGLLAGSLIAARGLRPDLAVWAAEPRGADDAYRSWRAGRRIPLEHSDTVADGLITSLGELTFPVIRDLVGEVLLAGEEAIREAVRLTLTRAKTVIEPSAAVPLAALMDAAAGGRELGGVRIGIILSGGNLDLAAAAGWLG